ncbi:MAG: class I SAM-dependent methyltransferase [Peptococcaceae bacterium]|jgi:trans-aconitate methyltransferase|nr:class I SAM-dependent methyltransferase [Peptococcaceae bacterium]
MENKTAEFDKLAEDYNEIVAKDLGKFGKYRDTAFIYKVKYLRYILKKEPKTILDYGCGIGSFIPYLHNCFKNAKLYGCDISSESIKTARMNYSYCDFRVIENVNDLRLYEKVDCVIINTVLHHIPPNEHEYWINGLYSILNENYNGGGIIVIFEHNMGNPLTKSFVKNTKIDENAVMLDPKYCKRLLLNKFYHTKIGDKETILEKDRVKLAFTYFFPWRNTLFTIVERFLFWLPLGAQYCVYAKK